MSSLLPQASACTASLALYAPPHLSSLWVRQLSRKHRWVFTAEPSKKYPQGGHRISKVHTLEKLKKLLGKLGLEGHLHAFRHFFASHCANNGVPPFQLVKWLGHADVSMVMHYYELHDEESVWAMKKLSLADDEKPEPAARSKAA